jgi:hypothetical protein
MEDLELDLGLPNNNANPTQVDNGKKTPQINISADFLGNSLETRTGIIVDPAGVAFSGNNTPMTQGVTGGSAAVGKRIEAIAASKDPNNGRPIDVNGKPVTSIIGEGSTSRAIFNNNPLLKAQDVKIIHAVGPKFDGDEKKFQETLTQTLKDTIKVWKDTPALQNEPLNFPLISGGNFRGNLDPNRYCEILLESLENAISDSNLSADQVAKISIAPYSKEEYTNLKKAVETNLTKSTQNTVTENLSATITPESPTNTNSPTLNPATTNNPADTANPKVGEALDILDQKGVDPKEALQKVYEEKIKIGTNRVNNFKNIESQLQKDKFLAADLDTFLKGLDKGKEEDTSLDAFNRLLTATLASNKTDDEKGAFIKDAVAKFSFLGNPVANKETEANNLLTAFTSLAVANPTFADIVEVEKKKYTDDLTEAMVKNVDAGLVADTPSTTTPAPVTTDPIKTKVDPNTKEKVDTGVAVAKGVTTVTLVATSAAFFPPIGVLLVVAAGAYFMNRGKGKEKKEAEEAAKLAAEQAAYDADPDNALSAAEFSKMVDERNATKKAALANIGEGGPDNEKGGAGQQSKDEKKC